MKLYAVKLISGSFLLSHGQNVGTGLRTNTLHHQPPFVPIKGGGEEGGDWRNSQKMSYQLTVTMPRSIARKKKQKHAKMEPISKKLGRQTIKMQDWNPNTNHFKQTQQY